MQPLWGPEFTVEHRDTILRSWPIIEDRGLRILGLCRLAGVTYRDVERGQLPRGKISAVSRGDLAPYPKLRKVLAAHLAQALSVDADTVAEYVFPEYADADRRQEAERAAWQRPSLSSDASQPEEASRESRPRSRQTIA